VAAPTRDQDGAVIASIGISAPITRFPVRRYPVTARDVSAAAGRISEMLSR